MTLAKTLESSSKSQTATIIPKTTTDLVNGIITEVCFEVRSDQKVIMRYVVAYIKREMTQFGCNTPRPMMAIVQVTTEARKRRGCSSIMLATNATAPGRQHQPAKLG